MLLVSLMCSVLVEVHSSIPYVTYNDRSLTKNDYVNLSMEIPSGIKYPGVQCHTDLKPCCSAHQGIYRGDWYFPNGTRIFYTNPAPEIFVEIGRYRIALLRYTNETPSGIYRCEIPTNAVHDSSNLSVRETIYEGMYTSGGMTQFFFFKYT